MYDDCFNLLNENAILSFKLYIFIDINHTVRFLNTSKYLSLSY